MTLRRIREVAVAALAAAVVSLTPAVARAVARIELHPFESATLTDREFLTGGKGKRVVIVGELRIPKPGKDRLPAVVLVHPSGGIVGNVDEWIQLLNGMGVATFVPGAQHVFDGSALKTPLKLPRAQTPRRCRTVETSEGVVVNAETKKPFTYDDPCVERGTTLAYDAAAAADAQKQVRDLVTSVLLAPR